MRVYNVESSGYTRCLLLLLLCGALPLQFGIAYGEPPATANSNGDVNEEAEEEKQSSQKRRPLYDPEADAQQLIHAAVAKAKQDGKHVIVKFGGNWCGWCYRLHDFFHQNEAVSTLVKDNYELVLIDVNSNEELLLKYGEDNDQRGYPFLTVLDSNGEVLTNQNTGDLEEEDSYDVAAVTRFLSKWQPERHDARKLLDDAKSMAEQEGKRVFVHLGAPWCGWCHRLDDFLADHKDRFGKDFVDVKIDIDRMRHGDEVAVDLRGGSTGGIPWFAVLDPDGAAIATSDSSEGNVGFPVHPQEVDHFMKVLRESAVQIDEADLAAIESALRGESE